MTVLKSNPLTKGSKITPLLIVVLLLTFSGCNAFTDKNSTESEISTETPTLTSTDTEIQSPSPTVSSPRSEQAPDDQNLSKKEKYRVFSSVYITILDNYSVNVINRSFNTENNQLGIVYEMADHEDNGTKALERQNISTAYAIGADEYTNGNLSNRDKSWVPKQVNVTGVTSDGVVYETAFIRYETAMKWQNGEYNDFEFLSRYQQSIEPGPANPRYSGS